MSRDRAIAHAERYFDEGGFFADLARRVAIPTESQNPERAADLRRYLDGEMQANTARSSSPSASKTHHSPRFFPMATAT
jgi:hypothetical protein